MTSAGVIKATMKVITVSTRLCIAIVVIGSGGRVDVGESSHISVGEIIHINIEKIGAARKVSISRRGQFLCFW